MSEEEERVLSLARLVVQRYQEEQAARMAWLDTAKQRGRGAAYLAVYNEWLRVRDRTEDAVYLLARLVRSLEPASATTEEVTE